MRKRPVFAAAAAAMALALTAGTAALTASAGAVTASHAPAQHLLAPQVKNDPHEPGCGFTKAIPFDRYKGLPHFTQQENRPYIAIMKTTQGTIVIRALTGETPCTAYSFRFLAQRGYFTGTHCHRLTTQGIYVLQCGDPTGTGSGGPGYRFNDEHLKGTTYGAGTVGMANAGPNTNGSQFFFDYKNSPIPPDYTVWAKVISGMDVLRKIAAAGDDSQNGPGDGYPHRFTLFKSITIVYTH